MSEVLPATPTELRHRVISLAWPVITENFLETLLGFVDTALVGALGASALAGVGTAQSALFLMIAILSALAIGNASVWPISTSLWAPSSCWSVCSYAAACCAA